MSLLDNMNQTIFGREEDTLKWFDDYLEHTSGSFHTSSELFRQYYHKCVEDLVQLQFDPSKKRVDYLFLDNYSDY